MALGALPVKCRRMCRVERVALERRRASGAGWVARAVADSEGRGRRGGRLGAGSGRWEGEMVFGERVVGERGSIARGSGTGSAAGGDVVLTAVMALSSLEAARASAGADASGAGPGLRVVGGFSSLLPAIPVRYRLLSGFRLWCFCFT